MTVWIVSPTGTAAGAGTIASPRDIDSMIVAATTLAAAGDTILMRGGTYTPLVAGETTLTYLDGRAEAGKGCYTLKINGSSGSQITIRNYPGEAVRINGGLHAVSGAASYITIQGVEIAPTPTTRVFANQAAVDYPALYITAPGIKLYNSYLHDLETIYPMESTSFEMNGCVVGWCGFYSNDVSYNRGYNLYAHNHGGGTINIKNNVFLYSLNSTGTSNFLNCQFFGTTTDVRDYNFLHNTVVWGLVWVGNGTLINSGNKINNNYFMGGRAGVQAWIEPSNNNASDIEILDNYIWDRLGSYSIFTYGYKTFDVERNQLVVTSAGEEEWGYHLDNGTPGSMVRDNNIYYGTDGATSFRYNGAFYNFAGWKTASGFDLASTQAAGLPASNVVALTVCDYGTRGIVTVQNFLSSNSITIDLTALGLTDGATCRYYNCLNMAEYVDFTYHSSSPTLTISMLAADWSLRSPTAYDSPTTFPSEPFPSFGAFLVEMIDDPYPGSVSGSDGLAAGVVGSDAPAGNVTDTLFPSA